LSGSRWLAFSMTEQPARDADWSQSSTKIQQVQMAHARISQLVTFPPPQCSC
jgi:hypothetical protein